MDKRKIHRIIQKECSVLDKNVISMITKGNLYRAKIAWSISAGNLPIELLAAIEMTHSASLLHDDVLDNEKWRRGAPSINNQLGNKRSILSGDILLSSATSLVAKIGNKELLDNYLNAVIKTCQGEMEQQQFTMENPPSIKNYIANAQAKTGSFFGFAAYSGALFSPIKKSRHKLQSIFLKIGGLYQLLDDLTDSTEKKQTTTDLENNAINFPIVLSQKSIKQNSFDKLSEKQKIALFKKHAIYEKGRSYIQRQHTQLLKNLQSILHNPKLLEAIDGIFH